MKIKMNRAGYWIWRWKRGGKYIEMLEHRLVMEQHIGRELRDDEVVHHRNHDQADNRIENLEIMTVEAHMAHHGLASKAAPYIECAGCGAHFERDAHWQNKKRARGIRRHFCSKECRSALAKRNRKPKVKLPRKVRVRMPLVTAPCLACGVPVSRLPKRMKAAVFCSPTCALTGPRRGLVAIDADLRRWGADARAATPVVPVPRMPRRASPGRAPCERCGRELKLRVGGAMRVHFVDGHKQQRCA